MSPESAGTGWKVDAAALGGDSFFRGMRRRFFATWLVAFYVTWLAFIAMGGLWVAVRTHLPIAVAMAGGSFVGGSSPVAGGTVGFPVLVYLFGQPARLGRNFCLAIQSIGMVSASIYILTRGRMLEWRILRFALVGAALAMPMSMAFIAPRVSDAATKVLFSTLYASFGLLHIARLREIVANHGPSRTRFPSDPAIGAGVGALGGVLASILGVGADILLYGTLVLLYHSDIKIAIPSAVVLMAFTSIVGAACAVVGSLVVPAGRIALAGIFPYWLAAAPVVVLGGPLGSFVSRFIPRWSLLGFVAVLCLFQYVLMCIHEHIVGWYLVMGCLSVLALNAVLHLLFVFGRRSLPPES